MRGAVVALVTLEDAANLSGKLKRHLWARFMQGDMSLHSAHGRTLEFLLKTAQRERIPFTLTVHPEMGFSMQRGMMGDI